MKRFLIITVLLLTAVVAGRAQCPDFTDLTAPGVTCKYGIYESPGAYIGLIPGRHSVITQQGADPYTNYQLPILPPGESAVVKLGNDQGNKEGEVIDYQFVVDSDNAVLTIKYAVVLKNFGNLSSGCPMFSIFLLGESEYASEGYPPVSINPCGVHSFSTGLWLEDDYQVSGPVTWLPWTTLNIDLSQYVGQQIIARFITYDGKYSYGEFGYAYFTASCMGSHLTVLDCDGQHITLAAPEGYANYQWSNGSTVSTSTYALQGSLDVSCHIYSELGCEVVFDNNSIVGLSLSEGDEWHDTICQGDGYSSYGFQLPPQEEVGTFIYSNISLNPEDCMGTLNTLHLMVRPRNVHYTDVACEGADYDHYGFQYTNLPAGSFVDSIPNEAAGCYPAYKYLHLTVSPSLSQSGELFGDTYVCDGQLNTYLLNYSSQINECQWDIPEGVSNSSGDFGPLVNLYFTPEAANPTVVSVTGTNGCGSHTFTKTIWHSPSYYLSYEDTACTGSGYSGHGIQTPLLNEAGLYYLSQHNTTENGCDSDVMVRLWVGVTPGLAALALPAVICEGEAATVHALGENAGFYHFDDPDAIKPGDILCTDNTIVKPEDWPCGKVAKGIVFYVDSSGQHGWAVHPEIAEYHEYSINVFNNPSVLPIYQTARAALLDINGYSNTHSVYNNNPTSWIWSVIDFTGGWYIPALGQLRILFEEQVVVDFSLQLIGGTVLFPSGPGLNSTSSMYWSSSGTNPTSSTWSSICRTWFISSSGTVNNHYTYQSLYSVPSIRGIINF